MKAKNLTGAATLLVAALLAWTCGSSGTDTGPAVSDTTDAVDQQTHDEQTDLGPDLGPLDVKTGLDKTEFVPEGCESQPYGFACPCTGNDECVAGFCVETSDGFVCTEECLEECPAGWKCKGISGYGADVVFLCVPSSKKLCFPCKADSQCGEGMCVPVGDETFCSFPCSQEDSCPAGFDCLEEAAEDGTVTAACKPASGSCDCLPANAAELRPCQVDNEMGTCFGYEECDPVQGWGACSAQSAVAEECNGKDDDCDGAIDEGVSDTQACTAANEYGTCKGTSVCLGPLGYVCQAPKAKPEECDYADNDCDVFVEEDFTDAAGKYVSFNHCGSCAISCEFGFPNATAKCETALAVPK